MERRTGRIGRGGRSNRSNRSNRKRKLDGTADIVDAALRLATRVGVAKLSMRALARELGVTPMAIYHHVPSKNALLKLLRTPARVSVETRPRNDQPLTESDIISAALSLVRRGGADKLSMRSLAGELNVTPMAIYHYVPNKRVLIARVADSVLASLPMPEPNGKKWESQLRDLALVSWERMSQYPGLLPEQPSGVGRQLFRYALSILLVAGFDEANAQLAITAYHTFMLGVVHRFAQGEPLKPRAGKKARADRPSDDSYRELVLFGLDSVIARLQQGRRSARIQPADAGWVQ
jgi:AcrR family transcriptional regulator